MYRIPLLATVLILGVPFASAQTVHYVDDNALAGGDGQTWSTAFRYLQDALAVASAGDDIRVAEGSYRPDQDEGGNVTIADRDASFFLPNGVRLLGGYAGPGTADPDLRDPVAFVSTLTGDLAGNDDPADFADDPNEVGNSFDDNSYRVVQTPGVDASTELDGFFIVAGNANGTSSTGAGLATGDGAPLVRNCTFYRNRAFGSGGAILAARESVISDCSFIENLSGERGGAIAGFSLSALTLQRCTFERNETRDVTPPGFQGFGGAVYIQSDLGALLEDCVFLQNQSSQNGASIYIRNGVHTIRRCHFEGNSASSSGGGGGVLVRSDVTFEDCTFTNNTGRTSAGGISILSGTVLVDDCAFTGNVCGNGGAAISTGVFQGDMDVTVRDSSFVRNRVLATFGRGGAISFLYDGPYLVQNCRFEQNTAGRFGGAIDINDQHTLPQVEIYDSEFLANSVHQANSRAGAIFSEVPFTCVNSVFVANQSENNSGGAVAGSGAGSSFINCTFIANHAGISDGGGAVAMPAQYDNCILWGNTAAGAASQVRSTVAANLTYSDIEDDNPGDGLPPFGGATNNNISVDPLVVRMPNPGPDGFFGWRQEGVDPNDLIDYGADDDYGDMRLLAGSPCIDAGDNSVLPSDNADVDCDGNTLEAIPLDVAGLPRFVDDLATPDTGNTDPNQVPLDMGAHEFGPFVGTILFVDASAAGAGDGSSWGNAVTTIPEAMSMVTSVNCGAVEVRIAAGTYLPGDPNSTSFDDTFELVDGVALLGGYAGIADPNAARDPNVYVTVLSGDRLGNDDPNDPGTLTDNVENVVGGGGTSAQAILGGVTIQGGAATTAGGGVRLISGDATLRAVKILANNGACAPALSARGANLTIDGVTIDQAGESVSFSQSALRLERDLRITQGQVNLFATSLEGAGALRLAAGASMAVRSAPTCEAGLFDTGSGAATLGTFFKPESANPAIPARWDIVDAPVANLRLTGRDTIWIVAPSSASPAANLRWRGQLLEQDLSAGGIADARFQDGGQFDLTGRVYELGSNSSDLTLLFDGVLISGRVSGFRVTETTPNQLQYDTEEPPILTPQGGFLVENDAGFVLGGRQVISAPAGFRVTQSGSGALLDFAETSTHINSVSHPIQLDPSNPTDAVCVTSAIRGQGDIDIEAGASLTLEGQGVLNLSGGPDELCEGVDTPGLTQSGGRVNVQGSLIVRDNARVQNTDVRVKLLTLRSRSPIVHNDIRLLESSTGFGGEFFASDDALISCNRIVSDGDRYLDLDPDPDDGASPTIVNNQIEVLIKQGVRTREGELLELRAVDFDHALGGGESGVYQLASSFGYGDTWALEKLVVLPGAKVNLTNRQGFEFQDPNTGTPEAIYVRRLKLHPSATLNTGLQRLYFQELVDEANQPMALPSPSDQQGRLANNSFIIDVPMLGFSLKVIRMQSQPEFDVRVRTRVEDTADMQPLDANQPRFRGAVERLDSILGGVMEMRTRAPDSLSARSVAAHGAFARAGDELVTVKFRYLFRQESQNAQAPTEVIVYLSDAPDVGGNRREVARIYPPLLGEPGSTSTNRWASFSGQFPSGTLNFRRGTYVELELLGDDSVIWIDDFDPEVTCATGTCGDVTGDFRVDELDYLVSVSAASQDLSPYCLDDTLNRDGYVDVADVLAFDSRSPDSGLNACASGLGYQFGVGSIGPVALPDGTRILVAGKPNDASLNDQLYPLDGQQQCVGASSLNPPSLPLGPGQYRGNGRLATGANGEVYQIHATQGLLRLGDAVAVVPPGVVGLDDGSLLYVGINASGNDPNFIGVPLTDVAFHPSDPNVVFIAPVVVEPADFDPNQSWYTPDPDVSRRYRAAARLTLTSAGNYQVDAIYGMDPRNDALVNTAPPQSPFQSIRELEVDNQGRVFVLTVSDPNDSEWLLVYDELAQTEQRIELDGLDGPTAMLVSRHDPNTLLIASASVGATNAETQITRYRVEQQGGLVTGLAQLGVVTLAAPAGLDPNALSGVQGSDPVGSITSLAEDPNGNVLVGGYVAPNWIRPDGAQFEYVGPTSLFTIPTLTKLASGITGVVVASRLDCHGLALPLSAIPLLPEEAPPCGAGCNVPGGDADANDDCVVNLVDLAVVLSNFGLTGASPELGDTDGNGEVNITDLANMLALFGQTCPP